jgi:hypothetical protein
MSREGAGVRPSRSRGQAHDLALKAKAGPRP